MPGSTRFDPSSVKAMLSGIGDRLFRPDRHAEAANAAMARISRLGMSPRQQALNQLWAWYRCEHYSSRKLDWNGKEVLDPVEHEAVAAQGFLPGGFYDAGGNNLPIKFLRPTAPYAMVKVIVDRFTGMLFSERHHPALKVEGDPDSEAMLNAIIDVARLWPSMIQARTFGGATGSVCVGFQFVDGVPVVEVHDPRWVNPKFADRSTLRLAAIEKRYMYFEDELDPAGVYRPVPYWYRRVIDANEDTLFKPAPVEDGEEPQWVPESVVAHGLGFCPVVWAQNLPVQDDVDGDPDCLGVYELLETIDALLAQANKGIVSNCDPTVVIADEGEIAEVRKGSENSIKVDKGGSASYMEITGSGPKAALELAELLRKYALEVTQCVLEHPDRQNTTATEIERVYSAMIAKADIFREQYGEKCVKPLVEMMARAVRKLGEGVVNEETGVIEKQSVTLPMRTHTDENGSISEKPHQMGPKGRGTVKLQWPSYFEPMLADVEMAARAAMAAKTGGLIDAQHASAFVAEFFKVDDVLGMLQKIKQEQSQQVQQAEQAALQSLQGPFGSLAK